MSKQVESLAVAACNSEKNGGGSLSAGLYQNLDAEKVLHRLGKYGTYQMLIYAMSSMGALLFAMETMIMSLISKDVDFSCVVENPAFKMVDRCTVKNILDNSTHICGHVPQTRYLFDDLAKNSLTGEFELVCDRAYWAQHSTSIFMIASQCATPIIASLSDRYGRRLTFLLPLWITVISNICCSVAPNYYLFLVFRFFAGLGTAGMGTVGFVIQIECVTSAFRSISPLFITFIWVFGYMLVGVLHIFIENWRHLYFCISAPGLITFGFYWLMPESIHWLISNKRSKEVGRYIKQSCRINRREIKLHECRSAAHIEENIEKMEEPVVQKGFMDMFKSWPLVFHLIIHCYIMIVMNGTYWALSLFSVELHENEMVGYFLSGIVELPAGFIAIALLWYFGRRSVTAMGLLAQALCMFFAIIFPGKSVLSMSFPLLAKVFNSIAWTSEPLLVGEMSPTIVRNVFFGCTGFVGEIGSILAPYTNALKEIHPMAPPFVICAMSVVAAIASLSSPETRDQPLPETIEEFDAGPVYRKLFGSRNKKSNLANLESDQKSTKDTNNDIKELTTLLGVEKETNI